MNTEATLLAYLHYGNKSIREGSPENRISGRAHQQLLAVHVSDGADRPELFWNLEKGSDLLIRLSLKSARPVSTPAASSHTAVVHLTLSLRCQVGAPADDLAVFASPAEQSAALQGAQGEHAALVGSGLTHYLEGLCGGTSNIQRCSSAFRFRCGLFPPVVVIILLQHRPLAPFPNVLMSAADFPHVRMFPSESPVRTSPVRLNAKHWMNLGFLYF